MTAVEHVGKALAALVAAGAEVGVGRDVCPHWGGFCGHIPAVL